ncbi:hypothetical protein NW762_001554 [Fusarium torreyae]|uniref:AB hydrolase-1 domain-containing protein n=1 Tax=Fusarium torreyae TaxID=1237075 RepID=A0A9W8VNJ6_9HYPO|nr:hypothetical protein NW762_001554 [Fusarium torreyae]
MGHGTNGVTWEADRDTVLSTATPYFEQGKEVVLVGHSYGGVPVTVATEGQGVAERAKRGLPGGFHSVIFMSAFAVPTRGMDVLTASGGTYSEGFIAGKPYTKNQMTNVSQKAFQLLYNDATEDEAKETFGKLLPHSQDAFELPLAWSATDITIPKTFLMCENDLVFPLLHQQQLIKAIPGMREAKIVAGHSPFLGKSMELAKKLIEIAKEVS